MAPIFHRAMPWAAFAILLVLLESRASQNHPLLPHFWIQVIYGAMMIGAPLLLWREQQRNREVSVWWAVDVVACTYLFVPIFQIFLPFPRPDNSPIELLHGFPSGHAVSSWALCFVMWRAAPKWALPFFVLAGWISLTRVQSHAHFAWQVWFGAICGWLLGWVATRLREGILLPRLGKIMPRKVS